MPAADPHRPLLDLAARRGEQPQLGERVEAHVPAEFHFPRHDEGDAQSDRCGAGLAHRADGVERIFTHRLCGGTTE